jgi:hypothetical protein
MMAATSGAFVARRAFLGSLLAAVTLIAACSSGGGSDAAEDAEPSATTTPSPSADVSPSPAEPSPTPSPELPVSPIPDGRYSVRLTDAEDTFFGEAPVTVVLTLEAGEYSLSEKGIQFESGIYWGVDDHVEFDAGVGPCSGAESYHEYDWELRGGELRFESEGGQICLGRLLLFTENVWRPQA